MLPGMMPGFIASAAANETLATIISDLGLTANLQICLDAGDSVSYTSGQSWLDRSGNGQDFFLGVDGSVGSDDPTFNGTPGGLSSSEYWSFDGGDFFDYDASTPSWMRTMYKDNAAWTYLCAARSPAANLRVRTWGGGWTSGIGLRSGIGDYSGNGRIYAEVFGNSGSTVLSANATTFALGADAWHIFGVGLDEAAGSGGSYFFGDGSSETFDGTYSSPSVNNFNFQFSIGSLGSTAGAHAISGTRIACFAMWTTKLSATQMGNIYNALRGRFGI